LESLKIPHGKLLYLICPSFFELFSKTKLTDFHLLEQNLLLHNPHKALLYELIKFDEGYYLVDLTKFKDKEIHIKELYEGYVIVDFVPTSENLSAWFLKIVQKKMDKLNIKVSHVEFLETPKSKSTFYA
jgi:hypothetical protein